MKQDDVDEMCKKTDTSEWIKKFQNVYPESFCSPIPSVRVTSCMPMPQYCGSAKNLQDCAESDKSSIFPSGVPLKAFFDLAKYLETEYKCTGICDRRCSKYLYSDCSRTDMEAETCDRKLIDVIKKNAATIGGISGVCALIGCFLIMSLICLCYNKQFGQNPEAQKVPA